MTTTRKIHKFKDCIPANPQVIYKTLCGFEDIAKNKNILEYIDINNPNLCKHCKRIMEKEELLPNSHKNLINAIKNKVNLQIEVTADESAFIQSLAFSLGVYWYSGDKHIQNTSSQYLLINKYNNYDNYGRKGYTITHSNTKCTVTEIGSAHVFYNFSLEDDGFITNINKSKGNAKIAEVEKSACGKTLHQFLEACHDNCTNMEGFSHNKPVYIQSQATTLQDIRDCINQIGLNYYRIKEPFPSIKQQENDGWTQEEIDKASFNNSNVEIEPLRYYITEEELKNIKLIINNAIQCNIKYFDGVNSAELVEEALKIKHKALFDIMEALPETNED